MPSIETKIDRVVAAIASGLNTEKKEFVGIYAVGLKSKFSEAEYALEQIKTLRNVNAQATTASQPSFMDVARRVHFFVDAFFAFAYSTLDVMSQIIDQKQALIRDEEKVSFNRLATQLESLQSGTALQIKCSAFRTTKKFGELEAYRNCSTHRRHIFIEQHTCQDMGGYSTSSVIPRTYWLICDDPYSPDPQTTNRELADYCEAMFKRISKEVIQILGAC